MNNFEVDTKNVINLFADLNSRQQKRSYRNALRKAANILSKEARRQLKREIGSAINHRNNWNNKTLGSGIKVKVKKDGTEAKVHIMGDFRLKFFEKGTKKRYLRKSKSYRGKMKALYFFKNAKRNKESEIFSKMDSLLEQSIQKISSKNK